MAQVLIDMVATERVECDGRIYVAGECFQARPIVAAALSYQHKAQFATKAAREALDRPAGLYRRRDLRAEG